MSDRINVHGLQWSNLSCMTSSTTRRCRAGRRRPGGVLAGCRGRDQRSGSCNREPFRHPRRPAGQDRPVAPRSPRRSRLRLQGVPTEIGYPSMFRGLPDPTSGVDSEIARPPGRSSWCPSSTRVSPQRRQRALGLAYDALYGTDVIPERRTVRRRSAHTTRSAATRSSPTPRTSGPGRSARVGSYADVTGLDRRRRAAGQPR